MSGRIPQNFIDELLARTDIVDLIDSFVPLKKMGKDYKACCPFHDEKTPSFTVSQAKQFYHCFGCGANGTAISFLMEYRHLEFLDAVEELAERAGLSVPREAGQQGASRPLAELYELMELVVQFYCRQLREHAQASRAVDYLKQRGISGEVAKTFELGFAPAGWDNLIQALGKSEAAQERLSKTGMTIRRDNGGYYDRFRDRIMFPIRDQRGRVIGFGGRVLDDDTPKYLNSPETPIYHKGRELYGLFQARHRNRDLERLIVVEGYMDVIALAQFGISNAVASLGTATTVEQMERMFRIAPEIVFCFDGDIAGTRAANRALETVLPLLRDGRQVSFRFLPEGQDPDDFVRQHGAERFLEREQLRPLSDYAIETCREGVDMGTVEGRTRFTSNAAALLGLLPDGVFRQAMMQRVETLSGLTVSKIAVPAPQSAEKRAPRPAGRINKQRTLTRISRLIAMLLKEPRLATVIGDSAALKTCGEPGADTLGELIDSINALPAAATTAQVLERWRGTRFSARFHELSGLELFDDEHLDLEREFREAVEHLLAEADEPFSEAKKVRLSDASEDLKERLRKLQK